MRHLERGFSLIEGLVTMLIVTVGMLALGSFYLAAIKSESRAQERVAATHFAEQILENWQVMTTTGNFTPAVTPDCQIAGVAAGPLAIGVTLQDCIPNAGFPIPFDILIQESNVVAPIPNSHLLHSNPGVGAPEMNNLLTDPTVSGSPRVKVRVVRVSWTESNVVRDVVLTHITRKP